MDSNSGNIVHLSASVMDLTFDLRVSKNLKLFSVVGSNLPTEKNVLNL